MAEEKECCHCGAVTTKHMYNDQSGKYLGKVCRNCWMRWKYGGTYERKRVIKEHASCNICKRTIYRLSKHGNVCTGCRRGDDYIINGSGAYIRNIGKMTYDERETCRRLLVKWKRGMLTGVDYYQVVSIYLEYHFKNEELDSLKVEKQVLKIMKWMGELFKKDLADSK